MAVKDVMFTYVAAGLSVLGFIFSLIGVAGIKWSYTPDNDGKVLYILCFILFIFSLAMSVVFIIVFTKKMLKPQTKNILTIAAGVTAVLDLLGLILNIIALAKTASDFSDFDDIMEAIGETDIPSSGEKGLMKSMMILSLILFVLLIPTWVLIALRCRKEAGPTVNNTSTTQVKVNYGTREINLN